MRRPSGRQLEVLQIIVRSDGWADGWAEVLTHYDCRSALDFRNFDRVIDALEARNWVAFEGDSGPVMITDEGRRVLARWGAKGACR